MDLTQIENLKQKARLPIPQIEDQLGFQLRSTLLETLQTITWPEAREMSDGEQDLAEMALSLHCNNGRLATSLAIAERYHPEEVNSIRFGEVLKHVRRQTMIDLWNADDLAEHTLISDSRFLADWAAIFLEAEYPRGILVIGAKHFDPSFTSKEIEEDVRHPAVAQFDPWEALLVTTLVAQSRVEPRQTLKSKILEEAIGILPEMCLAWEEMIPIQIELGWNDEATEGLEFVIPRRPLVGGILSWESLKGEKYPFRKEHYDDELFKLLSAEFTRQRTRSAPAEV